ncbi:MAG: hypothetical protein ACI861_000748 [Paracoccaceae bacterium]|jgi:hypothetical protein
MPHGQSRPCVETRELRKNAERKVRRLRDLLRGTGEMDKIRQILPNPPKTIAILLTHRHMV